MWETAKGSHDDMTCTTTGEGTTSTATTSWNAPTRSCNAPLDGFPIKRGAGRTQQQQQQQQQNSHSDTWSPSIVTGAAVCAEPSSYSSSSGSTHRIIPNPFHTSKTNSPRRIITTTAHHQRYKTINRIRCPAWVIALAAISCLVLWIGGLCTLISTKTPYLSTIQKSTQLPNPKLEFQKTLTTRKVHSSGTIHNPQSNLNRLQEQEQRQAQEKQPEPMQQSIPQLAIQSQPQSNNKKLNKAKSKQFVPSDPSNVVHIVYTRFMQVQSKLVHLGLARLQLFDAFFLTSLRHQTSQNFLLVIRTDPKLNDIVKTALIDLLEQHQSNLTFSYVLVASNRNPKNDPQLHDLLDRILVPAKIRNQKRYYYQVWSGTVEHAQDYILSRQHNQQLQKFDQGVIVLETRLDADDGLHKDFVKTVQEQAVLYLNPTPPYIHLTATEKPRSDWRVWMSYLPMEWQYEVPWRNGTEEENLAGSLIWMEERFVWCVTAGLTIGYATDITVVDSNNTSIDTSANDITNIGSSNQVKRIIPPVGGLSLQAAPVILPEMSDHDSLCSSVKVCDGGFSEWKEQPNVKRGVRCLYPTANLTPSALRARTFTSAGMYNVLWTGQNDSSATNTTGREITKDIQQLSSHPVADKINKKEYTRGAMDSLQHQGKYWSTVASTFGISRSKLKEVRRYMTDHMHDIAVDNLKGQCSMGHSCKEQSQEFLKALIEHTNSSTTTTKVATK